MSTALAAPRPVPRTMQACGIAVALIGALVLFGWATGAEIVTRLSDGLTPMAPNSALMFVLCGAALALLAHPAPAARRVVTTGATVSLVVSVATLCDYALGVDLRLDGLIFDPGHGADHPGRPSPHTALAISGVSVSLLLGRRDSPGRSMPGHAAALITTLVVLFAVVGFLFGVRHFHGVSSTGMALHSLLALVVLTVGLLSADPTVAPARWFATRTPGALAARRLVPVMVMGPLVLSWLVMFGWERDLYGLHYGLALLTVAIIATFVGVSVRIARVVDREHDRSAEQATRYGTLVRQAPVGIYETGALGGFVAVNERWCEIAGIPSDRAVGTGWANAVHGDDRPRVLARWSEAARQGSEFEDTFRFRHADGEVCWVASTARPVRAPDGTIAGWIGTCLDITGAHQREAALAESEERFRTALDGAPIGMALVGLDGRWLRVNRALCDMTGYAEGELLSRTFQDITHPDDLDADLEYVRQTIAGERDMYTMEKRYFRADGHTIWVQLSVALVRGADADAEPRHFVAQIQDISDRKRYERDLEHLADHDPLTGLFNRRRLAHELEREIARAARSGTAAALLMIDLDNFKEVNDSLGHKAGDEVIRAVAVALRDRLRGTDVIARLGGDEFAVLLPDTDERAAETVAASIVQDIRRTGVTLADGRRVHVTASTGVAPLKPGDSQTDDDLLVAADVAMYEAKDAGRDRLAVHRPQDGGADRAAKRLSWSERIRRALDEDLFVLHYQPIADLADDRVDRYEALIRLQDEEGRAPIAPNTFLPIADRYGLMPAIDRWVVAHAIKALADPLVPAHVSLEVNLSARSLSEETLLQLIERETAVHDVDPRRLIFEVTETTAVTNIEQAKLFARRLTRLGCSFALDDFGTGFASLHSVKHLPYRYVKIDGDFIRAITHSPNDQLMVRALVDVATGMQKQTIAEYVGDAETYKLLRELGVDYAQGFFVGRPEPLADAMSTGLGFTMQHA